VTYNLSSMTFNPTIPCHCHTEAGCVLCLLAVGLAFGDALIGRYLNPRIWKLDVKMFFIFNIALLGHLAVCAVTFIEAYQREKLNTAMIIMGLYSTILFLQYIVFQV